MTRSTLSTLTCACRRYGRQAGFSLITAIFLLVVLAALGVAMVTISTMQHQSSALDVQGVRAYEAAKAGIEWGLYQHQNGGADCGAAPGVTTSFVPPGDTFSSFVVTVTCTTDDALGIDTAVIRATACNIHPAGVCPPSPVPASSDYVQRVVEVSL